LLKPGAGNTKSSNGNQGDAMVREQVCKNW
jgi:hypothetical protein